MALHTLHIADLKDRPDLFVYDHTKGNTHYYTPVKKIEIQSINMESGCPSWNRITEYTVHENLNMYKVMDIEERFEPFWVSDDHSMIVWDDDDNTMKMISPLDIMKEPHRYVIPKLDEEDEVCAIPCIDLIITRDESMTTGYDFTVENDFTFCTYDGVFVQDTAALYMPLSLEAQRDCEVMCIPMGMNNTQQYTLEIKHELILAAWIITDNKKPRTPDIGIWTLKQLREDLMIGVRQYHVHQTLTVKLSNGKSIKTILGRALFNATLPEELLNERYGGFIDEQINSKKYNGDIVPALFEKYSSQTAADWVTSTEELLRVYTSVYPASLVMSELSRQDLFADLKRRYESAKTLEEKQQVINEIEARMKDGSLSKEMPMIDNILRSGSRGTPEQLRQVLVCKGILQDPQGNFLSINESLMEGLEPKEAFMQGFGARKGMMDRSRATSMTGYLYRKLVYAMASVMYDPEVRDCGTDKTVPVKITKSNSKLLEYRYIVEKGKLVCLTRDVMPKYIDKTVNLRTPIYCKSHKLCKACYGDVMHFYNTKFVGILGAESMGERGTQQIMKNFHLGGAATVVLPNLVDQAVDNNPDLTKEEFDKYLVQEGTKLKFAGNFDVEIVLKFDEYLDIGLSTFTLNPESSGILSSMDIEGTSIKEAIDLKPFAFHLLVDGKDLEIIFDEETFVPTEYYETSEYKDDRGVKCISLKANSANVPFFANINVTSGDMNVAMQAILTQVEKKNTVTRPEVTFKKLCNIYGARYSVAYNHIEVLVSQLYRNRAHPEIPARLIDPYDAKYYGVKQIPHLESFMSGMLFENMSKSLMNGFVNDSTIHSPIEQLLTDDFDFERNNR